LLSPPGVMVLVASCLAGTATVVIARPAQSDAGRYGRRIAGTMLAAGALILGGFAWALKSWGAAP